MKIKCLLLVAVILSHYASQAQVSRLIGITKTKYNGTDFSTVGDTTYYIYSGARDTTNNGNLAYDTSYVMVSQTGYTNGNLSYRYFQGFGGTNNIDSATSQYFDTTSTSWVNNQFLVITYNTDNNVTSRLTMNWNAPSVSWVNAMQVANTYVGLNNTLKVVQNWNTGSSAWVNATKDSFAYDASSNLIYHLAQVWDTAGLAWTNTNQYLDTFNTSNQIIKSLRQTWSNAAMVWKNNTFTLYDYNSSSLLSNTIVQKWDSSLNGWLNFTGDSLLYYTSGDASIETLLRWDSTSASWTNAGRYEYTYDSNHDMLTDTLLNWVNTGGGKFDYGKLHLYTYNTYSQVLTHTTETWNTTPPAWTYHLGGTNTDIQYRYYYQLYIPDTTDTASGVKNIAMTGTSLNVGPNPTNSLVTVKISWGQPSAFDVIIIDINGSVVRQWSEPATKTYTKTISVNDLPAGTYFIKARSSRGQLNKTFVVVN